MQLFCSTGWKLTLLADINWLLVLFDVGSIIFIAPRIGCFMLFLLHCLPHFIKEMGQINFILYSFLDQCYCISQNTCLLYLYNIFDFQLLKSFNHSPIKIVPILQLVARRQRQGEGSALEPKAKLNSLSSALWTCLSFLWPSPQACLGFWNFGNIIPLQVAEVFEKLRNKWK